MKQAGLILSLLVSLCCASQEDYTLRLNDSSFKVALDKDYSIQLKDRKVSFRLIMNDTLVFDDDLFSFRYSKDYKVTKTEVEPGIAQFSILTAEGSGFLIQRYSTFNPEGVDSILLREFTKESISYGFKETKSREKRKLASGQELGVTRSVLTYKDEINIFEVGAYGNKDEGVVIATVKMSDEAKQGDQIIELLWKSLKIK